MPILLNAQIETTLPSLSRTHQATNINPAILPSYSTSFGLPVLSGFNVNFGLNGLNLNTIKNSIDTGKYFSLPMFYNNLKGENIEIDINTNFEIFHVRFKSKNWFYGISLTSHVLTKLRLSKEFVGLAANGNDFYAGKAWDVSSTQITSLAYNDLAFSMARNFNRFNFGARAKMYQGVGIVQSTDFTLKLNQPLTPTDAITVKAEGRINTAGVQVLTDSVNGRASTESEKNTMEDPMATLKNLGAGLDFGLTYDVSNRLTVGASIIDFGFINWSNQVFNYNVNTVDVKFDGVSEEETQDGKKQSAFFDSIANRLNPTTTNDAFTTYMPWRFYLTGNYKFNKRNTMGAIIQGRYLQGEILPAYTLSFSHKFGSSFDLSTNYSIIGNSYANWGLGFVWKMGAVQWYLVQDNLLAYINPSQFQYLSFRMGLNLVFGEIKQPLKVY